MHQVFACGNLPARRGCFLPPRAGAASAQSFGRYGAAALRAGAWRARHQIRRSARGRDGREQKRDSARGCLRAGAARPGLAYDAGARRAAARGDSRHLRIDWRLGARPHGVDRTPQRCDPHGAVSRRIRRTALPRLLRAAWWRRRFGTAACFCVATSRPATMPNGMRRSKRYRVLRIAPFMRRPNPNCSGSKARQRRAISASSRQCSARRRATSRNLRSTSAPDAHPPTRSTPCSRLAIRC